MIKLLKCKWLYLGRSKTLISGFIIFVALIYSSSVFAACDCGSTNSAAPCTGQTVTNTVTNGRTVSTTWTFTSGGGDARCGQFANGDYWFVPAVGQTTANLTGLSSIGSGTVRADINPTLESQGLLAGYSTYNASENITSSFPVAFSVDSSIVAAVQKDEATHGGCGTAAILGSCVDIYSTLTFLDAVPENAGSTVLRPSVTNTEKELLSLSQFDFTRLPAVPYLTGTDSTGLAAMRQRYSHHMEVMTELDITGYYPCEGNRCFRADLLVNDYSIGAVQVWNDSIMQIFSGDSTLLEMTPALAALLTYGKDVYYSVYAHNSIRQRAWGAGAGQNAGKFPAAVFFAALYDGNYYGDILMQAQSLLGGTIKSGPHELEQINPGVNGPVWGDNPNVFSAIDRESYWGQLLGSQCYDGALGECLPSSGSKDQRDPYGYIDGPANLPGNSYMIVNGGPTYAFVAIMSLFPRFAEIVNYPLIVEYADRLISTGIQTQPDNCAPPDPNEDATCIPSSGANCLYYGLHNTGLATWGPNPLNTDACIVNNTGGNTGQTGRFPARHGIVPSVNYPSSQVTANWTAIRNITAALGVPKKPTLTGI